MCASSTAQMDSNDENEWCFMLRISIFLQTLLLASAPLLILQLSRLIFLLLKPVYPRHVHSRNHDDGYGFRWAARPPMVYFISRKMVAEK